MQFNKYKRNISLLIILTFIFSVISLPLNRASAEAVVAPLKLEAEAFNVTGGTSTSAEPGVKKNATTIGSINNGDWVKFNTVDLSTGYNNVSMNMATQNLNTQGEVWIDCTETGGQLTGGTKLATITTTYVDQFIDGWQPVFSIRNINLSLATSGTHNVYFLFKGSDWGVCDVDWIQFNHVVLPKSTIAYLGNISVDQGVVSPVYDKDRMLYTVVVNETINSIKLFVPAMDVHGAVTKINGVTYISGVAQTIDLPTSVTNLAIDITAEDGLVTKAYRVTIQKKKVQALKNIYVSPNGNDDNLGTQKSPFKTLSYAALNASPDNKSVIHMSKGEFNEITPTILPSGVSIVGAGTDKTIINSSITHNLGGSMSNYGDYYFTIQARNSNNASISGIKFNGKLQDSQINAHAAIFVKDSKNFSVHDIVVTDFEYTGVWFTGVSNCTIYNGSYTNSGRPDSTSCTGNIMIGDAIDTSIHDNIIRENRGGYGIKGWTSRWVSTSGGALNKFTRLKIYNNDIDLRQAGGWGAGQPNMSIELWKADPTDCEIYNNKLRNCTSLPGDAESNQTKTYRIYNNQFLADTASSKGYTYFIEAGMPLMEIDHNYFEHGYYPIASFGKQEHGENIHDNIFYASEGVDMFHFQGGLKDSTIKNNIIYTTDTLRAQDKGKLPIFQFDSATSDNLIIENNIFYSSKEFNDSYMFNLKGSANLGLNNSITNNVYFNWKPYGINASTEDPKINTNDFRLSYDSLAYKYGFKEISTLNTGLTKNFFFTNSKEALRNILVKKKGDYEAVSVVRIKRCQEVKLDVIGRTLSGYQTIILNEAKKFSIVDVKGTNVATINKNGDVTAQNLGVAKVTATVVSDGVTKTSDIYIEVLSYR